MEVFKINIERKVEWKIKKKSLFQERLVGLYLRLNGYVQTGYIPHSEVRGNEGTDIDRIAIKFPLPSQTEREVLCSPLLTLPKELIEENPIDIVIAEVKNKSTKFNNTLIETENRASENWGQMLRWIGLFEDSKIDGLVSEMIEATSKNGILTDGNIEIVRYESSFGVIVLRPVLFSMEKSKKQNEAKFWINGVEILSFIWECFAPEAKRILCSVAYNYELWGFEYKDIVIYIKDRYKKNPQDGIGTFDEMYNHIV